MKTDKILTMNEYFDACCGVPKHVDPPADNAGHIPITSEGDIDLGSGGHGCRCDRWGYPSPGCPEERKPDSALRPTSFCCNANEVNKMEYVIAFGVVAMMALYVLIVARCLREPEWQ